MLKNYLKIAFRNIKKNKVYSFINIAGLAVGMACTILILLWIQDELSFDKFHKNANEIYRIIHYLGDFEKRGAGTPAPLAPKLKEEIPEIINYTRFAPIPTLTIKYGENVFYENRVVLVDPSIFDIFTFSFIKGTPKTALSDPSHMVLTEAMAQKYFGNEDPLGKTMAIEGGKEVKVIGVIRNLPHNSHIQLDFLMSFQLLYMEPSSGMDWSSFNFNTYVQLKKNTYNPGINKKINEIAIKHNCHQIKYDNRKFFLQPLKDVHLDAGTQPAGVEVMAELGDRKYVYIFSIIAIFILFIACINFINLTTARSVNRTKEVGMRKTIGANRLQLIKQFLGESFLFSLLSIFIAITLIEFFLPIFNRLSGKYLSLNYLDFRIILLLAAIVVLTGILSGIYPALYLSSFSPIRVIKGNLSLHPHSRLNLGSHSKGPIFRKVLVVFQFSLAIGLIIATTVVYLQIEHMKNKKLGFDKDNIVYLPVRGNIGKEYETVKNQLLQHPDILAVTAKDWLQIRSQRNTSGYSWEGRKPEQTVKYISHCKVDYDYIETMNIKIIAGRNFSKDHATDAAEAFIVNKEAVKAMNLDSPVGKKFRLWGKSGKIIGVMQDTYFSSLHHKINPQVYHILTDVDQAWAYGAIFIKIRGVNVAKTLSIIENEWNSINSNAPFEYHFFDEAIDNRYQTEKQTGVIFNSFTFLAIFISCLGLFGLASFMVNHRTKEIGIRKVLGATVSNIVTLNTREFTKWVLIANIFAWPAAWITMNKWLQNFAYPINISMWTFVLAGMLALFIALLTVSYQAIRASTANPVEALRYE